MSTTEPTDPTDSPEITDSRDTGVPTSAGVVTDRRPGGTAYGRHAYRRQALRRATPAAGPALSSRGRGRAATLAVAAAAVAAVAAATLSGCGIRSTAVPVDAGLPASRTACPQTPPTTSAGSGGSSEGPAMVASPAPGYGMPAGPTDFASETSWAVLSSAFPAGPDAGGVGGSGDSAAASVSGSVRAGHGSASPRAATSTRGARATRPAAAAPSVTPAPVTSAASGSSGFNPENCAGASATGSP